ncbi:MAG: hypothetical protein WBC06_03425 [Chitinophagaceae bacterium]
MKSKMKSSAIQLTTLFMFIATAISAQKKTEFFCKWKTAAELPALHHLQKAPGVAGPITGVHQNKLIVAGGANFPDSMPWQGGKKKYYNVVYVYEKKGGKVVLLKQQFTLPFNIAYAASCSATQGIVYAGGENENGFSNKVFLLQWDKKKSAISAKQLPELPFAITNAAATVVDNIVYIAGGETADAASDQLLALDLIDTEKGWNQLPRIPKALSHSVLAALSDGNNTCIYLIGGRSKNITGISDLYNSAFQFNIRENRWEEKKSLPYTLSAGTGIAVSSDGVLLFGGDKGTTFHKVEMLIAAINAEKDETIKKELIQKKNKLQTEHPGFSKEVLHYNTLTDSWKAIGNIPFDTPVTTTAVKWGNDIYIPSGEIRAGIRSPQILKVKILQK